ncbi:MAG: ATP synthase F1 subunit delta [Nitrospirae bacterium]|nr:ATP synthase F1 subunit delta [Nitrospirota bacterium]
MKRHKQTNRFAKTLIDSAGLDAMPRALSELTALNSLMESTKEFRSLLIGPQFTDSEKNTAIKEVGSKLGFSEDTIKFVSYLSALKAMTALADIIRTSLSIYLEKKRKAKATVYTPSDIGRQYEDRLRSALKKLVDRDIDIEYVTEPSILGGMLIRVGSSMYDGSIKGQLRLLKEELVKG